MLGKVGVDGAGQDGEGLEPEKYGAIEGWELCGGHCGFECAGLRLNGDSAGREGGKEGGRSGEAREGDFFYVLFFPGVWLFLTVQAEASKREKSSVMGEWAAK